MELSIRATRTEPRARLDDLLRLTRPGQWAKNVLVVSLPLLDLASWRPAELGRLAWAVAAFTLAAVLVYILNDVVDRELDRAHPTNRHRPIASGRLSLATVAVFGGTLAVLLALLLSSRPWAWAWPIAVYLVVNLAYSLGLKHVPLLDVFLIAIGFLLRLVQGYVVVEAPPSGWLLICVFSVCLLFTVGKRRHELVSTGAAHRPALSAYTVALTDQLMVLSAMLSAGSYFLYLRTEAPLGQHGPTATALIAPLALFGLFRYLQLALVRGAGGDPVRTLLRDPVLVVNALLWAVISAGFLLAARSGSW
jgi:4-hydroxybenzoate polyprenyltransferase